jgi:hypothetical protein
MKFSVTKVYVEYAVVDTDLLIAFGITIEKSFRWVVILNLDGIANGEKVEF